jgi:hypothetical protein
MIYLLYIYTYEFLFLSVMPTFFIVVYTLLLLICLVVFRHADSVLFGFCMSFLRRYVLIVELTVIIDEKKYLNK